MAQKEALKQYWTGYRIAGRDLDECGESYARERLDYGLSGWTAAQVKGYRARLAKFAAGKTK